MNKLEQLKKLKKIDEIESSLDDNTQNIGKINDTMVTKSNAYNKTEVDAKIWGMSNLGQDVKEAMTGGSVAVVGVDGVGTQNLLHNSVSVEKSDFIRTSINLFNKYDIFDGYINSNGGVSQDVNYSCSNFIPIKPNTKYIKKETSTHAFYDKSKKFIGWGSSVTVLTSIDNAYYIRISMLKTKAEYNYLVEGDVPLVYYEPYSQKLKYEDDSLLLQSDIKGTKQVFTYFTEGVYLGRVRYIDHVRASDNYLIRRDEFIYSNNLITEYRVMNKSKSKIIYKYNLVNNEVEVI